jgi:hypothetical protein
MNFSSYFQEQIADFMIGVAVDAPPVGLLLALSTANPLDDGSGIAEPIGLGYARQAILFNAYGSVNGVGTTMTGPTVDKIFTAVGGAWNIITHWAIFRSDGGGEMMWHGAVSVPKNIQTGDSFVCNLGSLSLTIR